MDEPTETNFVRECDEICKIFRQDSKNMVINGIRRLVVVSQRGGPSFSNDSP